MKNSQIILEQFVEERAPLTITLDDITYKQVPYTELFTPNGIETYTVDDILSRHFSSSFKAHRPSITLPNDLLLFSKTIRTKAVYSLFYDTLNLPDETFKTLTNFFQEFENYPTPNDYFLRQYRACKFAANNSPDKAAALFLYCGPVAALRSVREASVSDAASLTIRKVDGGLDITTGEPVNLQVHLQEVLIAARAIFGNRLLYKKSISNFQFFSIKRQLFQMLFSNGGQSLSLPKEIRISMAGSLMSYLDTLNNAFNDRADLPDIPEVETAELLSCSWMSRDLVFKIKYDDFIVENAADHKREATTRGARLRTDNNYRDLILKNPDLDGIHFYSVNELATRGVGKRQLKTFLELGYIKQINRIKYQLRGVSKIRPSPPRPQPSPPKKRGRPKKERKE